MIYGEYDPAGLATLGRDDTDPAPVFPLWFEMLLATAAIAVAVFALTA